MLDIDILLDLECLPGRFDFFVTTNFIFNQLFLYFDFHLGVTLTLIDKDRRKHDKLLAQKWQQYKNHKLIL